MHGNYEAVNQHARRRLTIFFSDIAGFTEIAERLEPEDMSHVLNQYFSEMSSLAERHGGTVDKFIGDAVMIIFGAPLATPERDQARAAVQMAREMQSAIAALREEWLRRGIDLQLRVRMGINTGVATVGNFGSSGRMDYTAIGRQVNLAARLQASCPPGGITISHTTWLLVRDEVACLPRGEVSVKGIRDPVPIYEVEMPSGGSEPLSHCAG
jgi:class 3 adenylate cyclase